MSVLSVASRIALEAEREDGVRKMITFWTKIGDLKENVPQNALPIDFLCYTVRVAVWKVGSPILGLEHFNNSTIYLITHLSGRWEARFWDWNIQ